VSRFALPTLLACGAFFTLTAAAQAATLSLALGQPDRGMISVTLTGETEQASEIILTVVKDTEACPTSIGSIPPPTEVPAGPFSRTTSVIEDSGRHGDGAKRVCGYLFYKSDGFSGSLSGESIRATASAATTQRLAVRGVGVNTLRVYGATVNGLIVFCVIAGQNGVPSGCTPVASATIKVSAATRRKLGLRSTTIASADKVRPCGEADCLNLTASKAVRDRLKKVKSVPVVYSITVAGPIRETVTQRVTLLVQRTTKLRSGAKRLAFRSADDTFAVSGRP
jgi:hypothetical protein